MPAKWTARVARSADSLPPAELHAWDLTRKACRGLIPSFDFQSPLPLVILAPDGKTLATAHADNTVRRWDAATLQPIGTPLGPHRDKVSRMHYSPDGKVLVTRAGKELSLWDAVSGKPIGQPGIQPQPILATAFSPDSQILATGLGVLNPPDGKGSPEIRLWKLATGEPLGRPIAYPGYQPFHHPSLACSPDGRLLLTGGDLQTVLWETDTAKPLRVWPKDAQIVSAAFSPDGKLVLTASRDRTARLWRTADGRPAGLPMQHADGIPAAAFSPDGRLIATASADRTLRLWDTATTLPVGLPLVHPVPVVAVTFTPDSRFVITGAADRAARLWEVPEPLAGEPEVFAPWARAVTGLEIDASEAVRVLNRPDRELWGQALARQGATPRHPVLALRDSPTWHYRIALESVQQRQWWAARWHLDRYLRAQPQDKEATLLRAKVHALIEEVAPGRERSKP